MKAMTDILNLLVVVGAGIAALLYYYWYANARTRTGALDITGAESSSYLYIAIAATVIALVAGVLYFLRHVNKEEEIHITQ